MLQDSASAVSAIASSFGTYSSVARLLGVEKRTQPLGTLAAQARLEGAALRPEDGDLEGGVRDRFAVGGAGPHGELDAAAGTDRALLALGRSVAEALVHV